jgi:acetate kinase
MCLRFSQMGFSHASNARAAWPEAATLAGSLGGVLDANANARDATCISAADSPVEVRVIPTDEEQMIALHTLEVIGTGAKGS